MIENMPRLFQVTCKRDQKPHEIHSHDDCNVFTKGCVQPELVFSGLPKIPEEDAPPKPRALFDLDNTLCDFKLALKTGMDKIAGPGEPPYEVEGDHDETEPPHLRERRGLVKRQPGFWRNLPRFAPGFEILAETIKLGYQHTILSKGPRNHADAWKEKVEWVRANISDYVVRMDVVLTEEKEIVYGRVLVDDWPPYIKSWLRWRPRGFVIMPAHGWNAGFEHWQVIRYDGTNLLQVREALRIQYATSFAGGD